jgi:hypothetical protein
MEMRKVLHIWLLLLLLCPLLVSAEAQIKHFFPAQSVLLGQPQFWIVEVRHPMWESYELKFSSCPDLKMSVANRAISDVAGEIRTIYKIAVTPVVLKQSCTPAITISDEKGQTTVVNGEPLRVRKISGDSLLIKTPALPMVHQKSSLYYFFLFALLGGLIVLCAILAVKRFYSNLPSQRFLRAVRKAGSEVTKGRLPIQVWRLLRSEMIWGFEAEAFTPAQLQQKATSNESLLRIALTLQSLESWRYAGSGATWDQSLVHQALANAQTLVEARSPFHRFKRNVGQ